jgi:acetylornithine deacetylase/succinyl-diaminopimelate desuccinylase-like protein
MAASMIAALEAACAGSGRPWRRLVSGAGHDAGRIAGLVPAGMLFVPSRGGVSHSPEEHTEEALLTQGAWVFQSAVLQTLGFPSS